jgi:hypothetical protein
LRSLDLVQLAHAESETEIIVRPSIEFTRHCPPRKKIASAAVDALVDVSAEVNVPKSRQAANYRIANL